MKTFNILTLICEWLGIISVLVGAYAYKQKEEINNHYKKLKRTSTNDDEVNKLYKKLTEKEKTANSFYIIGGTLVLIFTILMFSLGELYLLLGLFSFTTMVCGILKIFNKTPKKKKA